MDHREFSSKGGKASRAKLTPEQRSEAARKAGKARQAKLKMKKLIAERLRKDTEAAEARAAAVKRRPKKYR